MNTPFQPPLEYSIWGDISKHFGLKQRSWQALVLVQLGMARQWFGRFRKWSDSVAWGVVFSDSHCQHIFSLGETEGSDGDEDSWKPRVGVFVYFKLHADSVSLESAKILRRASREEVYHYFVGPRGPYNLTHEPVPACARKRKRTLAISFGAGAGSCFDD